MIEGDLDGTRIVLHCGCKGSPVRPKCVSGKLIVMRSFSFKYWRVAESGCTYIASTTSTAGEVGLQADLFTLPAVANQDDHQLLSLLPSITVIESLTSSDTIASTANDGQIWAGPNLVGSHLNKPEAQDDSSRTLSILASETEKGSGSEGTVQPSERRSRSRRSGTQSLPLTDVVDPRR